MPQAQPDHLHTPDPWITYDDVQAAFGIPVAQADIVAHGVAETQVLFTLAGHSRPGLYVFVRDHQMLDPADQVEVPGWPVDDIAATNGTIGDKAFVTRSGGIVAFIQDRWTAGVHADAVEGWAPSLDQAARLLSVVVDGLRERPPSMPPPPSATAQTGLCALLTGAGAAGVALGWPTGPLLFLLVLGAVATGGGLLWALLMSFAGG